MEVEEKNKFVSILIWFSITIFYCYQYVLRVLPNLIMPNLMEKYAIGAGEFGSFAGIYYIGYIAVHIPIGLMFTRLGGKIVLPLCIAIAAGGLIPLAYLDSWNSVIIGRLLTGVGSSAAIVGAMQIFRILYVVNFSRMLGLMVFFGVITAVYVSGPLGMLIESVGIDSAIKILLYSGLGLSVVTYLLMPKSTEVASHSDIWSDVKAIIFNYKLLFASIFAGMMVGPMEGFADAWGSSFMITVYGIEKSLANSISFSILLGMCIGCIILPYIADKTRMYFGVTIASGLAMILCFVHILSGEATADTLYYACLITGIFSAYQVVILSKIATFVAEERSGLAGAVGNMVIMGFGWIFHNAIGRTLEGLWNGDMDGSVKAYSSEAFITAVSIIPAAIAIAIVGMIIIVMSNIVHARLMQKK